MVDLLKEFLESDLSQKAFAEHKQMPLREVKKLLWQQMMTLYKKGIVSPKYYSYEVRYAKKHKEEFLQAIKYFGL